MTWFMWEKINFKWVAESRRTLLKLELYSIYSHNNFVLLLNKVFLFNYIAPWGRGNSQNRFQNHTGKMDGLIFNRLFSFLIVVFVSFSRFFLGPTWYKSAVIPWTKSHIWFEKFSWHGVFIEFRPFQLKFIYTSLVKTDGKILGFTIFQAIKIPPLI